MKEGKKKKQCPYLSQCPMFKLFKSDFKKAGFKLLYCFGDFDRCVRKQKKDKGEHPPDDLLPDGKKM